MRRSGFPQTAIAYGMRSIEVSFFVTMLINWSTYHPLAGGLEAGISSNQSVAKGPSTAGFRCRVEDRYQAAVNT